LAEGGASIGQAKAFPPGLASLKQLGASAAILLGALLLPAGVPGTPKPALASRGVAPPIDHVIVVYLENRSFDHLYGLFPGADGIAQAGPAIIQVDETGGPYEMLPPFSRPVDPSRPPLELPALPNEPFDFLPFAPVDQPINASLEAANMFYQEQEAINGGKMDRFVATGGSPMMGYYDAHDLPMWQFAEQYVLADRFFHAAFGGTGINHMWFWCACTAAWPDASPDIQAEVAPDGTLVRNGLVTPDGYLVNNAGPQVVNSVPLQTSPHIGDRLDAAGITWKWYAARWSAQQNRSVTRPFAFFANLAAGTPGAAMHIRDEDDFVTELRAGMLPQVAFIKPVESEHPTNSSGLLQGDENTDALVRAVQASPYWQSTAIIVTYDEGNGFWDHVAPPQVDRWGPGARVPAIIISPYAKRGYVDHTVYDTTSILRFIEWRWNLPPLGTRDANANNLLNAFDFAQTP
jgi:phospholipase C